MTTRFDAFATPHRPMVLISISANNDSLLSATAALSPTEARDWAARLIAAAQEVDTLHGLVALRPDTHPGLIGGKLGQ